MICRIHVDDFGNPDARYIVSSFEEAGAKYLYDAVYCDRGNAELFIKDHKNGLKSDRASCHKATANQFRPFLHSAAYMLMHALRDKLLHGTQLGLGFSGNRPQENHIPPKSWREFSAQTCL